MAKLLALANLKLKGDRYSNPNIRNYNRIEGSPRSKNPNHNLKMEVRDPLWFLCRQWQFGEFQGEDAATAYQANIMGVHSVPEEITLHNGNKITYSIDKPLEMVIEREDIDATLFLRAQMGRHLSKILKSKNIAKYTKELQLEYPIEVEVDADDYEGIYLEKAIGHLLPDGYLVYGAIIKNEFKSWYETNANIDVGHYDLLAKSADEFGAWFHRLYQQPGKDESAWVPEHLEYNFALDSKINADLKRTLMADQYASGHLDWKDFDQKQSSATASDHPFSDPVEVVQTFIPAPLQFSGMPHPRLWQMEDGTTDFGALSASPTSIMNLLLAEYGLTYSNDWFVLPYELNINTICEVKGICITDVFGQHFHIAPTVEDPEMDWQEFAQFHHTERDNATFNESIFYLVPAVGKLMESEDIEKVNLMRDEMSNMVWAIENTVPSAAGMGRVLKRNIPSLSDFEPADEESKIRYVLGNTVPDNWIPFIPVHKKVPANVIPQEIRLQRARMPQSSAAKSKLISEVQPVYFIEEQEVLSAGTIVTRNFQRTRWINGKTFLWLGRRKAAGRGEGSANLKFDQLLDIRKNDP
ncbi:hypothetical protein [Arenibacter certesii]|uniref:Uncharacterized protein n=1 Tax=Arenibacter certesii TaxID=228955 RepID=A0A918IX55_9FLAO|nr:hypothetical protein [Arenibacter certesii]GGW37011.1 hypothetical protein GCM10007383_22330 [Arenibacter certesii]